MCHPIHSSLDDNFPLEDVMTADCHDTRWLVIDHIRFPELSCVEIFSREIEIECTSIVLVFREVESFRFSREELIDHHSLRLPLHSDSIEWSSMIEISHHVVGWSGDDDMRTVFFRRGFETRGEVHGISEDSVVEPIIGSDVPYHHFPSRDPDSEIDRIESPFREFIIELWESRSHGECCLAGSTRMVRKCDRCTEKSHHRISDIFIEGSSIFREYLGHTRKIR